LSPADIVFLPEEVIMKKINFLIGMAGISLALAMTVIGCDTGTSSGGGGGGTPTSLTGTTWDGEELPAYLAGGLSGAISRLVFTATTVSEVAVLGNTIYPTQLSNAPYTLYGNTITITAPVLVGGGTLTATVRGNKITASWGMTYTKK
jgi:hypothetical protein